MQDNNVNMQDNYAYMQDNYVYMQVTSFSREPDLYMDKTTYLEPISDSIDARCN